MSDHDHDHDHESHNVWMWTMVSVLIVTVCCFFGPLLSPLMRDNRPSGKFFLTAFVALGAGVIVGDAILHLLPAAFGIHSHEDHDEHGSGSDHDHEAEVEMTLGKLIGLGLCVLCGIYFFFLLELTIAPLLGLKAHHHHGHHPAHDKDTPDSHHGHSHSHSHEDAEQATPLNGGKHVETKAYIVLLGDTVHNLLDGLVLGVAFATDKYLGFSTLIAVILHEIPHEIGDFAILLKCNMSFKRALILTLLSQVTAFIGAPIGVALGADSNAQPYLLALTAGFFLYIGLVDLLPEIAHDKSIDSVWTLVVRHVGLIVGVGLMCVVLYVEDMQMH